MAALGPVMAIGAVASDPDFAAAPPLVPLAPVCAKAPAADNASTMAATGMISARITNSSLLKEYRSRKTAFSTDLIRPSSATGAKDPTEAGPYYAGAVGGLVLRSWETAVTSCAGANGFANMMLLGTPLEGQSAALAPLM